jgi:hypothetical protein
MKTVWTLGEVERELRERKLVMKAATHEQAVSVTALPWGSDTEERAFGATLDEAFSNLLLKLDARG